MRSCSLNKIRPSAFEDKSVECAAPPVCLHHSFPLSLSQWLMDHSCCKIRQPLISFHPDQLLCPFPSKSLTDTLKTQGGLCTNMEDPPLPPPACAHTQVSTTSVVQEGEGVALGDLKENGCVGYTGSQALIPCPIYLCFPLGLIRSQRSQSSFEIETLIKYFICNKVGSILHSMIISKSHLCLFIASHFTASIQKG